jgi:hypothetical protein
VAGKQAVRHNLLCDDALCYQRLVVLLLELLLEGLHLILQDQGYDAAAPPSTCMQDT